MQHPSQILKLPVFVTASLLLPAPSVLSQTLNPNHTFRVYERDGIQIAENRNGPRYLGEIFRYELVLRLKEDESRPETLLGQVTQSSLMGEDGSIYVVDHAPMMPARIVRFDPSGHYANEIGRLGQGPGEYQNPSLLAVEDGRVILYDPRLARTACFRPDGSLIETIPVPIPRRRLSIQACYPLPGGRSLLIDRISNNAREGYRIVSKVVTICTAGGDTLATFTTGPVTDDYIFNQGYYAWRVFAGSPEAVYAPGSGVYLTTGLEPRITVRDLTGRIIRIIDAGIPPERVTRSERRSLETRLREWVAAAENDREKEAAKGRLEHVELNDPKAYWNDLIVDEYGYLWCERPDQTYHNIVGDVPSREHRFFRVFNPDGEYLGDTRVPTWGSLSRGHFIALEDNEETGGFEVVLYRIRPAVEGMKFPD
jgi:hypothetical protein